jgi:hypothetical protein
VAVLRIDGQFPARAIVENRSMRAGRAPIRNAEKVHAQFPTLSRIKNCSVPDAGLHL